MRRAKRDGNHTAIVRALLDAGRSVQDLSAVGGGCPDLLVGFAGRCVLLEIKCSRKEGGSDRVSANQVLWHRAWRGTPVVVVRSVAEALEATGITGVQGRTG